jgi:hypothetical protein
MTTFLLLLSLILNAAAIFAIILLYLRQNRLVEAEKKQERILGEIEEVFSAYLLELKEENNTFIQKMKKTKSIQETKNLSNTENSLVNSKSVLNNEEKTEQFVRVGKGHSYHAAKKAYNQSTHPASKEEVADPSQVFDKEHKQLSLIDQVLIMKKQGFSIEEIARNLDKGKTEIELLLKFRQNT